MIDAVRLAAVLCAGMVACAAPAPCVADEWPRVVFLKRCLAELGMGFTKWSKGEILPFVPGGYLFRSPSELAAWIDVYSKQDFNLYLENRPESARVSSEKYRRFVEDAKILRLKKNVDVVPLENMIFGKCNGELQGLVRHPEYGDVYLVRLGLF